MTDDPARIAALENAVWAAAFVAELRTGCAPDLARNYADATVLIARAALSLPAPSPSRVAVLVEGDAQVAELRNFVQQVADRGPWWPDAYNTAQGIIASMRTRAVREPEGG